MAEDVQPDIAYAPPASRARRLVRRLSLPVLLLLTIATSYLWGPPLWHRLQLAYWYDRCAAYEPPPDAVVWERRDGPQGVVPIREPHVPREWKTLYGLLSPPGFRSDGTAFLGDRRTPAGARVLIAIDIEPSSGLGLFSGGRPSPRFHYRAVQRRGFTARPVHLIAGSTTVPLPPSAHLRIFPGLADPADPTHFTIPYEADGRTGAIDGWVRDNHVHLELARPVSPPLPASAARSP